MIGSLIQFECRLGKEEVLEGKKFFLFFSSLFLREEEDERIKVARPTNSDSEK